MRRSSSPYVILALAVVVALALVTPANAQRRASAQVGANCAGGLQALFEEIEPVPLTAAEEAELLYLREEEKLARDVYLTLAQRWQLPIFSNIAAAEQKHMDLVHWVIEIYSLVDPITDDTVGMFTDPVLDTLFDQLVAVGEASLIDALTVGATIEDMDLADLYELLGFADNDHVQFVAYNLAKGSRNHLRAYVRALTAQSVTYECQYLSEEEFDAVFEAETERRVFYNADGEAVPSCGTEIGDFGVRRGSACTGGPQQGTGTGECSDSGSSGNGDGTGPSGSTYRNGGN